MKSAFLAIVLLEAVSQVTEARGVDLGLCEKKHFQCACGDSGLVNEKLKQCSYAYKWRIKCKPCNKLTEEDVCERYKLCRQCHLDGGDSCVSCPKNKFGTWCENTCTCQNGGICQRNGECVCSSKFEGKNCEKEKVGCEIFKTASPLSVAFEPPDIPMTAIYSCPPNYVLSGTAVSMCVKRKWSTAPPTCRIKCPILSSPADGRLTFSGSDLVEGVTAEVQCNEGFRLVGQKTLTCVAGGRWNTELPFCEEMATCPDPGFIQNGERIIPPGSAQIHGHFLQDSKIQYRCNAGFEQLGASKILCTFDGTWSNRLPLCIKVATVVLDCKTVGSEVIAEEGVHVRISCPPECSDEEYKVWGTSIYRIGSSVCRAATHSAKITNSGGVVDIVNNGDYTYFTGSLSNYIQTESFPDEDHSFRFDKVTPVSLSRNSEDCGKGLTKLDTTCMYVSNLLRNYEEAKAVCTNLGLVLEIPEERARLATILNVKGIKSVWADEDFKSDMEKVDQSNSTKSGETFCPVATVSDLSIVVEQKPCNTPLNYICIEKTDATRLPICKDPGSLANGRANPIGQINNVYYVGASIEYSCQTLYSIKGARSISCTGKGTWSDKKPECVQVEACEDVPVPIGGFVTYLPPIKTPSQQRSAIHQSRLPPSSRAARIPVGLAGLAAPIPQNVPSTTESVTVALPSGLHRLGTRAMYDCESRYYNLIGSRTRRCQEMGEWSGRPPTCMPVCGRSDSPRSPFIVNGNATDIGQWPWQAGIARYLVDYNQWFLLCGASLINELWLITAAHCVTYAGTTLTIEADKFQVYLGKYHRLDSKDDEYVQVRKIHEIHIHPDYDPGLFDADIALILMDSPVHLNSRVQPVCLPTEQTTKENLVEGKLGVVTGWGMNENETYAERLQQAVLPVVSNAKCEKGYQDSDLPLTVTDNMFCAGYTQGRSDACSGDSGGPMVFTDESSKQRKWVLEGIVSWGSPRGCGNANQYGGFTTVSRFLDWIHLYF